MSLFDVAAGFELNFVHKKLFGAVRGAAGGFVTGGPLGAIRGAAQGISRRDRTANTLTMTTALAPSQQFVGTDGCRWPGGVEWTRWSDGQCRPGQQPGTGIARRGRNDSVPDLPPTLNITTPAEGDFQMVAGAFGMPAAAPKHEFIGRLFCPKGMVLGEDELCYPKAVLRRDSRFRKHRPGARPILTGGQRRGIARARANVESARDAISGLGVTVKKK